MLSTLFLHRRHPIYHKPYSYLISWYSIGSYSPAELEDVEVQGFPQSKTSDGVALLKGVTPHYPEATIPKDPYFSRMEHALVRLPSNDSELIAPKSHWKASTSGLTSCLTVWDNWEQVESMICGLLAGHMNTFRNILQGAYSISF